MIANGGAHFFDTVGDAVARSPIEQTRFESVVVAMTAGDADGVTRRLHARATHESFIDRLS